MIHAYPRMYLSDAEDCLSCAFDYAINSCMLQSDELAELFVRSGYAKRFETGNPAVISGMSGIELVDHVLYDCGLEERVGEVRVAPQSSAEYWAGWMLAQYQWERACTFAHIFSRMPLSSIVGLYHPFHEADVTRSFERMDMALCRDLEDETRLARIRRLRGLSQRELARASGVGIKSIQAYEQRTNAINKAQVGIVRKLAWVLGCSMEALVGGEMPVVEYDGRYR